MLYYICYILCYFYVILYVHMYILYITVSTFIHRHQGWSQPYQRSLYATQPLPKTHFLRLIVLSIGCVLGVELLQHSGWHISGHIRFMLGISV